MSTHELREVTVTSGATVRDGAGRTEARLAVEAAEGAFPQWSATTPAERGGLLRRASELLMERQAEIAALVTEETNGTIGWGMFNVQLGAGMLAYYADQTDVGAEEQEIPSHIPGKRAKAVREPVGVVVGIAPWNAPVVLGVRAVAGATGVRKHRRVEGIRAVPADTRRDRGRPEGRGRAGGGDQPGRERTQRRRGGG
jgi:benzaldehyde dehydrogenase (NAD)